MPRHTPDATSFDSDLELLTENGFEGLSRALELLLNEAMRLERSEYLGVGPYERTGTRRGYANGFKPKQIKSRLGALRLEMALVHRSGA